MADANKMRKALERAERKLAAYIGVCKGDKELTDVVLPMVRAALAKQPAQGEAVAWGMPNTAITGKKMALMMVRLDVPSDDQYGGKFWVPLYTAPPATTSTVGAACVPDAVRVPEVGWTHSDRDRAYAQGWNACRAAMLAATPEPPRCTP